MLLDRLLRRYPGYTLTTLLAEGTDLIAVAQAGIAADAAAAGGG